MPKFIVAEYSIPMKGFQALAPRGTHTPVISDEIQYYVVPRYNHMVEENRPSYVMKELKSTDGFQSEAEAVEYMNYARKYFVHNSGFAVVKIV